MQAAFRQDFAKVFRYGDSGLEKLVYFKSPVRADGCPAASKRGSPDGGKSENNIIRARTAVRELILCNEWQLFGTFTLDASKYDRHNLPRWRSDFSQFLRDQRKKWHMDVKFLLIPEHHKNGAWHMHGVFGGLSVPAIRPFSADERLPADMLAKIRSGEVLSDWPDYRRKFGFVSFSGIRDRARCAGYVTKYVSKDLGGRGAELGAHLYYASQGLARASVIYVGGVHIPKVQFDFENEWVKIIWSTNPQYREIVFTD